MPARILGALLTALTIVLSAGTGWSYLPPARELLSMYTAGREPVNSLKAVYESPLADETGPPSETVFVRTPGRVRLSLAWPDREEVFLASASKRLVMVGDQATLTPWPQPPELFLILTENVTGRLQDLLTGLGIDFNKVALGRLDGEIVYILGAGEGDLDRPQLWFERRTMELRRFVLPAQGGRPGWDIFLKNHQRHGDGEGLNWPEILSTAMPDGRRNEMVLKDLWLNPAGDEGDFDLEELARTVAPPPETGAVGAGNPELAGIRRQMDWFRKKLE